MRNRLRVRFCSLLIPRIAIFFFPQIVPAAHKTRESKKSEALSGLGPHAVRPPPPCGCLMPCHSDRATVTPVITYIPDGRRYAPGVYVMRIRPARVGRCGSSGVSSLSNAKSISGRTCISVLPLPCAELPQYPRPPWNVHLMSELHCVQHGRFAHDFAAPCSRVG
jgi:hypothetical protein